MGKLNVSVKNGGIEFEINNNKNTQINRPIYLSVLCGIVIGFVNGFFGGGGGMICVPILTKVFALGDKEAHATTLFIMLPLSIISVIIYIIKGSVWVYNLIPIVIGVVIGGIIGSILLKKLGNIVINIIFGIIIIYGAIRMIF